MRRYLVGLLAAIVAVIVLLPALLVRGCQDGARPRASGVTVSLYLVGERRVVRLELEDYLVGVVAAEMPARFHIEALKAQAVAARTFTVKRLRRFGGAGSRYTAAADISDDPAEGQAWMSIGQMKKKWGVLSYQGQLTRIQSAVSETAGVLAAYQGQLIEAIYHSTCGGRTEAAVDVWGRPFPYLIEVDCGYDSHAPHYRETVRIPVERAAAAFGIRLSKSQVQAALGSGQQLFRVVSATGTGRARQVFFAGAVLDGERFRKALNLLSPRFRYAMNKSELVITTIGYGHGVGLCQYGADGLAKSGKGFTEILQYYYPGTALVKISNKAQR